MAQTLTQTTPHQGRRPPAGLSHGALESPRPSPHTQFLLNRHRLHSESQGTTPCPPSTDPLVFVCVSVCPHQSITVQGQRPPEILKDSMRDPPQSSWSTSAKPGPAKRSQPSAGSLGPRDLPDVSGPQAPAGASSLQAPTVHPEIPKSLNPLPAPNPSLAHPSPTTLVHQAPTTAAPIPSARPGIPKEAPPPNTQAATPLVATEDPQQPRDPAPDLPTPARSRSRPDKRGELPMA
ncbi:hypothetical protein CRENBAI_014101 [Crenichthys baileyi]|uniref:Vegetative cell wall protein gp1-like n=1 Tax=Crenichthys baileyi TaxID=28760 RepID=A0AAV9RJS3_9TELE